MKYLFTLFISVSVFFQSCTADIKIDSFLQEGVPLKLAEFRKKQISNVEYSLSFTIPKKATTPIATSLVLNLDLLKVTAPLLLDFKEKTANIHAIIVNGTAIKIVYQKEHLIIATNELLKGANQIEITFTMGELSLNRNEEYLYTLLVPDRARTLFPCFDQPNLKAKYALQITAPNDWKVLCGAPLLKTVNNKTSITHHFKQTDKISTYLFSFVAGKFEQQNKAVDGFDMNLLFRENDSSKIALSLPAIFNLHKQSIDFLTNYTAYSFPFQKIDFATIPGFQYGGMEHVGAIQYRENALFLDETATIKRHLGRAKLIAHETAHMWFGDLVTMDWFDDVWMKEVFANFMADKIVNPAFPEINHNLAFMVLHYPSAYSEDRTQGTNPIRQPLENLQNAGSLYGSIIYNKAPIMMRQLELVIGKAAFQKGIQEYINTYAFGNAVWNDLVEILDKQTPVDLKFWSEIWVNQASRPIFSEHLTFNDDHTIASFEIEQKAEDGSSNIWPQIFETTFVYEDTTITLNVNTRGKKTAIATAKGLKKPKTILYNSNGLGYGIFPLHNEQLKEIPNIKDPIARGYAYINCYENALTGNSSALDTFQMYKESLKREKNELLLNLLNSYITNIYWKFLSKEQRKKQLPIFEQQLINQLQSNLSSNTKKVLFNCFKSIAYSNLGKKTLYDIYTKDLSIKNLKLNKDDFTEIAMYLALFEHEKADEILEKAKKQLTNTDKLARFKFIIPSLSKKQEIRDHFFESLKNEENRAKESWVLSALNFLNHPLRQHESIKHLKTSLSLLDEIQKTGDIFFPKRWLASTIGKYTSEEAFTIREEFIRNNPNLNPALLKKLLQASDDLRRIQELKKL